MAKVFIGIMTYNRPKLVKKAIESVRGQSHSDFRVVVSDNASEADTAMTVKRFVESLGDSRFAFYQQSSNVGEYGQGRYLFSQVGDAEYFLILHDDDLLNQDYLSKGLETLEAHPECAFFVANPDIIDADGQPSASETLYYLRHHGRIGKTEGVFDVETRHMDHGFTPISGTLFRIAALRRSGYVNPEGYGNFPFECDIFIRLGAIGGLAWFDPAHLLKFRFHPGSLRRNINIMNDPGIISQMQALFIRPCHSPANNRRRKVLLARIYRAQALYSLAGGDAMAMRENLRRALTNNPFSLRAWLWALIAWSFPAGARILLPIFRKHYT